MAFHPATFNLTVFGNAARQLPHLQGNIMDLTPHQRTGVVSQQQATRIVTATEQVNLDSILDPIERRDKAKNADSLSKGAKNFVRSFRNRNGQSPITRIKTTRGQPRSTNGRNEDNANAITTNRTLNNDLETKTQNTKIHNGGHVSLMDNRPPEHADLFESSKVQGPVAVKTTTTTTTTTERPTEATTKTTVVTPRLAVPIPSEGSLAQLPVLWTALSLALGVEVQGEIVRGLPCIKRLNQLFCRNAGTLYPEDNIGSFIDDNKALTRRMYGDFQNELGPGEILDSAIRAARVVRSVDDQPLDHDKHPVANVVMNDISEALKIFGENEIGHLWEDGLPVAEQYSYAHNRTRRQAGRNPRRPSSNVPKPPTTSTSNSDRVDSCNSKMEIVTPYWASNSAGKILAIVNLKEFSQVIHQEICTRSSTKRCNGECGCEQKYKWHRMLAYDLENECKGIFVDWFLFPSCCVCRCDP